MLDFLQVAKWMMFNPERDKHPTTIRTNGPDEFSVLEHIPGYESFYKRVTETISDEDEERLSQRILVTLSRLSGQELKTQRDLSVYTRSLQGQGIRM
jgi:hypothetical protein